MKHINQLLQYLIRGYQILLSPLLPPSCRFYPTCSQYALEVLAAHGPFRGTVLAIKRIFRCQPFSQPKVDLPPPATSKKK